MSRRLLSAATLAALCVPAAERAAAGDAPFEVSAAAGPSVTRFHYREYADTGSLLDRERGWLPGVTLRVAARYQRWTLELGSELHRGTARYVGLTQGGLGIATTTDERLDHHLLRIGYSPFVDRTLEIGLGSGWRRWRRDIQGTSGALGLQETYRWRTVSIDVRGTFARWGGATFEGDLRISRTLDSTVEVAFGGLFDPRQLALGRRTGLRAAAPVRIDIGRSDSVVIEPGIEKWGFSRSASEVLTRNGTAVGTVFQPRGEALNAQLWIGWERRF